MSNMVTRCPQCHTSFRVTEEHLKLANGAVRCGSCLLVFQAREHWVNLGGAPVPPAADTPSPSNKFRLDQSTLENMAQTHAGQTVASRSEQTELGESLLGENGKPIKTFDLGAAIQSPASSDVAQKKVEDIGDDEKISDDTFLEDDEPVIAPTKSVINETYFGDPEDDYGSVFDDVVDEQTADIAQDQAFDFNDIGEFVDDDSLQHNSRETVADESWAKDILEEEAREQKPAEVDLNSVEDVRDVLQDFANPVQDTAGSDLGFGQRDPFAASELGNTQRGGHRADMIAHIDPLPVDLLSTRAGRIEKRLEDNRVAGFCDCFAELAAVSAIHTVQLRSFGAD
ncbi:MAG: zinc-ribbon domain-containing protein [Pseudomonadales bacterium]